MRLSALIRTYRLTAGSVLVEWMGGLIAPTIEVTGAATLTGAVNRAARETEPLIEVAYSAAPIADLSLGNQFFTTITDAVAFVMGAPINPPAAGLEQVWCWTFRNTSGGAHGAGTWNAVFKTQATVFPAIATGFSRSVWFRWNGVNHVEIGRTAADVAN